MLTDAALKAAKPKTQAYRLADSKGLFLFITPSGGKLWRWKYRFQGAQKLMALGKYPEVSLASARERHADARRMLGHGSDPMIARKEEKIAARLSERSSFQAVATQWFDLWKVDKSNQHIDSTRRRLEANVYPRIGTKPISDVKPFEIVAMAKAIEQRGAGDLAKRSLQTTSQIFRYAVAHGIAKRNPVAEFKPSDVLKQTKKINLARVDSNELPALLRAIEVYRGAQETRLAIKLIYLTFVRTSELIGAKWSEFDLENKRWNIPAERMKMDTPHIVPLSRQAIEVIELLKTLTGQFELLFPGARNANKPMSNNTILKALERLGYKGRQTGHGFRGIASTILHEQGFNHEHIELQLAHSPRNVVSAAYNHALYLEPRASMMQSWADFMEQTQRGGKVLAFRQSIA